MLISLVVVGGLGTTHRGGPFTKSVGITIVVFSYINIICFNFSIGTLSYTIASEMAVVRNRNKITAAAIGVLPNGLALGFREPLSLLLREFGPDAWLCLRWYHFVHLGVCLVLCVGDYWTHQYRN
jgi:hypothetical protein